MSSICTSDGADSTSTSKGEVKSLKSSLYLILLNNLSLLCCQCLCCHGYLRVNGCPLVCRIDTGAKCNTLTTRDLAKVASESQIDKSPCLLRLYTSSSSSSSLPSASSLSRGVGGYYAFPSLPVQRIFSSHTQLLHPCFHPILPSPWLPSSISFPHHWAIHCSSHHIPLSLPHHMPIPPHL